MSTTIKHKGQFASKKPMHRLKKRKRHKMPSDVVKQFSLEQEYAKKTGISPQDISKLREWLLTQPHLPGDHITDLDLILTFHCCDRSCEVSKQVLDLHYTLRTLFTGLFKDRFMNDQMELLFSSTLMTLLPKRSAEGHAAFYGHFMERDATNFVLSDTFRGGIMVLDLWQYEEGTWPGFIMLFDLQNMTLGHFAKMELLALQQFIYYLQDAMLVKLKGLHFLNAPPFMDRLLMLIKPFMKKALIDMIHVHQVGSKTLETFYPMDGLPKNPLGGSGKTVEEYKDDVLKKLIANKEFFIAENNKRVVESQRPGKPKTISDIFGSVEGSFKKLDID